METLAKKPISVFISYAREDDEPFVEKLYQDLKENGFDIWWDRATMKNRGRTFFQEIRDAIENSDLLIAVIGPKAIEYDSVRYEWEYALLFSKGVFPILCKGDYTLLPPEMPKLHCPDFRENRPYEKALEELIRLLREPIPPLGQMVGVPSLPPNYLPRKDDLNTIKELMLTDTIKPVVITSAKQITALQGMGGMGKSVLASAFARTPETRKAFYDGIFWVTVGLDASDSDLIGYMRLIGTKFGDDAANYSSKKEAEASLSKILSDKVCLIILDDIWKVPQATPFFNALGSRCRLLITTRNDDVVTSLGAQEHKIKVLSKREALKLLASWCEQKVESLPSEAAKVADECGYLPLALSICGAMVKSGISWPDILEALQEADLEFIEAQLPNYPDKNVGRALKVSIDFLSSEDPDAVKRYQELAVFPTDEFVPEVAIAMFWAHTGNLKKRNSGKLLTKLKDRSLLWLDGKAPNRLISLHDLQFDYLRAIAGDFTSLHNNLLEAYDKECGNKWSAGPEDGYFYKHLAYHMKEAGKREELRKLLLDFEWMSTKLKKICVIQEETGVKKPDVNSLLHDYDYLSDDTEIGLVQGAIKLSFNAIVRDKNQLAGQLLGRLLCFHEDGIQSLLSRVCECRDSIRLLPQISSLQPPGGLLIRTLEGHKKSVYAVAVTPDGRDVISGSEDRTLKIWDLEKGEEKTTLRGHHGWVTAVAVTPDGNCAISASEDKTLKVWDLRTGEEKTTFRGHKDTVWAVAVTPNGKYAVSSSLDKTLKIWDLEKGVEKTTLRGHKDSVCDVAVTPNGEYAVSASLDKTLKVWDLEKEVEKTTLRGHNDWLCTVAIAPNGKYAVSASLDGTLKVWDLEKREEKATLTEHDGLTYSIAFTTDGEYAISGYSTLKVWNLETGGEITSLKGHDGRVSAIAVTPDGRYAISASDDRTLKVWDLEKGEEKPKLKGHKSTVSAVSVTPDGNYAVSASFDGTLKVWDLEKREEKITLKGHKGWVRKVVVTPDGKYAVSASDDGKLKVWDLENGEEKATLKGHKDMVNAVAVTPDGKYAVSASDDRTLKVWDLEKGEEKTTLRGHNGRLFAVAVTPDGKYAVSASDDRTLKVWDLDKGVEKSTLSGHDDWVYAVSVTSDSKYVISASYDGTLKVWDLEKGKEKITLKGHEGRVCAVAVIPNGKCAVSASEDRTLKIWDLEKGVEKATLTGHDDWVRELVVTSDGKYAISASRNRTIKVYDLKKGEIISKFTGDSSFETCVVSPDGKSIIAGDALGKVHFLYFDKPD